MFINLLPSNTRLKIQFRRTLRGCVVVWGIAGACALLDACFQVWELRQAHHRLDLLDARCQPLNSLQRQMSEDTQRLAGLRAECETLERLQPSDHLIDILGILVRTTRTEPGRLQVQRLNLQAGQRPVASTAPSRAAATATTQPASTATLSLQGLAEDDVALTRFVAGLRDVGVFERVDLKSSTRIVGGDRSARQYQLECRYEDQP